MGLVEKIIATAFYRRYSLSFDYTKYDDDKNGITERRRLATISNIKYNSDNDMLVGGYIDNDSYDYRQFFLYNMSDIEVFKKITVEGIDK